MNASLLDIYLVNGTSFRALTTKEKGSYKSLVKQARVCISACSPTNLKNGAIKALHAYSETALMSYTRQLWVRSDDKLKQMSYFLLFTILCNNNEKDYHITDYGAPYGRNCRR